PNGRVVSTDQDAIAKALSHLFGREVSLGATATAGPSLEEYWPDIDGLAHRETTTDETIAMAAPAGTFFDNAPIHLVTNATLKQLRAFYPEGRFYVERFRPNLVLSSHTGESGFVENAWVGHSLRVGDEVRLQITDPCARCVM